MLLSETILAKCYVWKSQKKEKNSTTNWGPGSLKALKILPLLDFYKEEHPKLSCGWFLGPTTDRFGLYEQESRCNSQQKSIQKKMTRLHKTIIFSGHCISIIAPKYEDYLLLSLRSSPNRHRFNKESNEIIITRYKEPLQLITATIIHICITQPHQPCELEAKRESFIMDTTTSWEENQASLQVSSSSPSSLPTAWQVILTISHTVLNTAG